MGTAASCCAMSSTRRTRVSPSPQGWTASSPSAPARAATRAPRAPSPSRGRFANSGTASSCSGGAISDGHQVRAAEVLGADLAYMGTRFIATEESQAQARVQADARRLRRRRPRVLRSVSRGFTPTSSSRPSCGTASTSRRCPPRRPTCRASRAPTPRPGRTSGAPARASRPFTTSPPVAELVARLRAEYDRACAAGVSPALRR
jgi:hypothetical protein